MKILWVPFSAQSRVASVRLRCLYPAAWLRAHGHEVTVTGRGMQLSAADVAIFSKRYDAPALAAAQQLRSRGTRVVLDICDNHFYASQEHAGFRERRDSLLRMIECATGIVAASEELQRVIGANSPKARVAAVISDPIEDLHELRRVAPWRDRLGWLAWSRYRARVLQLRHAGAVGLVWFGNHGVDYSSQGGMGDLRKLRSLLERHARSRPVYLSVISNSAERFAELVGDWGITTLYLDWRARYFGAALSLHEVALIPVEKNPFTLCKTANRLALALAHGLAVIADSIPAYEPYRDVSVLDDWDEGLTRYLSDPARRRQDAQRGRERVMSDMSLDRIGSAWQQALERCCS
jgi:hypothetical protein